MREQKRRTNVAAAAWLVGIAAGLIAVVNGCGSTDAVEENCSDNIACVWVNSYQTRDGGYVPGHWQDAAGRRCPCAIDGQPRGRDGGAHAP